MSKWEDFLDKTYYRFMPGWYFEAMMYLPHRVVRRLWWKRDKKKFLSKFTPYESFFSGCGTEAALLTEIFDDSLIGIDLHTGKEVHVDAFHCLDGYEPMNNMTAFTIGVLGDAWSEAKSKAYDMIRSEDGSFYNGYPKDIMQALGHEWKSEWDNE